MSGRFSKAKLLVQLRERAAVLERRNLFNPNDGYSQVDSASRRTNRDYGEWDSLRRIIEQIESGELGV